MARFTKKMQTLRSQITNNTLGEIFHGFGRRDMRSCIGDINYFENEVKSQYIANCSVEEYSQLMDIFGKVYSFNGTNFDAKTAAGVPFTVEVAIVNNQVQVTAYA